MADFCLEETIALLEKFPQTLDALLRGLPQSWLTEGDGQGSWNASEIVAHLVDSERHNWIPRARLILDVGEAHTFEVFERGGHVREAVGKSFGQVLDEFARLRAENLAELRKLDLKPEDFGRRGAHPAFGAVTLGNLLATWVVHDQTHLHQLSRVLAGRYREAVGPWAAYLGVLKCDAHGG